ncbi:MAG: sulfite exporter TauE/SafE family protein [Hellea sp.]|nr:sulfite exporter TauE/SafE family protein [Hellea sp.]
MITEYFLLILILLSVGSLSGFSAGLFGVGGGAVMVPALYYAFNAIGVSEASLMHCAVGTSSSVIIFNSFRAVKSHHTLGAIDWNLLRPKPFITSYAVWIGAGSFFAASFLASIISAQFLMILFAMVMIVVSLHFIFGPDNLEVFVSVPTGFSVPVIGSLIGALSSLMGIGGGSITVPLMNMCRIPMNRAVATASGFGFAISLPATIGFIISGWGIDGRPYFSLGYVNVVALVCILSSAFFVVPYGAKIAQILPQKRLKLLFGICLLAVALNMAKNSLY